VHRYAAAHTDYAMTYARTCVFAHVAPAGHGTVWVALTLADTKECDMVNWTSGYIQSGTVKMHYQRAGKGTPVILAHGFSDHGSCWKAFAEPLTATYDVVLIDARGHGQSSNPGQQYTPADQAGDVRALISQLHLAHPFLIGHSMGAGMALAAAATYPAALRGVILEDPPLVEWVEPKRQPGEPIPPMHAWINSIKAMSTDQLIVRCITENPTWRAQEILHWVESKQQFNPDRAPDDPARMTPWKTYMAQLGVPALLIVGDTTRGALVSAETAAIARALSAHLEVGLIRNVGHCIRREAPDAFAAMAVEFLKRHKEH